MENNKNFSAQQGSEKSFGVVFSFIFLIIALYPLLSSKGIHFWAIIISIIFISLAFFTPHTLSIPNKLWFKFGMFLGYIIAPIVMIIVYLTTVLPIGLVFRLLRKDLLRKRFDVSTHSYWILRNEPMGSMKNQF